MDAIKNGERVADGTHTSMLQENKNAWMQKKKKKKKERKKREVFINMKVKGLSRAVSMNTRLIG